MDERCGRGTHLRTEIEDEDRVVQVVNLLSGSHLCQVQRELYEIEMNVNRESVE